MGISSNETGKAEETKRKKYGKEIFSEWGREGGKKPSKGYFGWLKEHPEQQRAFLKERDRVRRERHIDKDTQSV